MPTFLVPRWLSDVSLADLARAGVTVNDGNEGPASAMLTDWANDYGVDFVQVDACLALLNSGPFLLHVPAPLAVMAYSPRRQRYRASIDADCELDLADLNTAAAGTWLTVLAAETGSLPISSTDCCVLRIELSGISGTNQCAVDQYRDYARLATLPGAQMDDDNDDHRCASAVWRCAGYAMR